MSIDVGEPTTAVRGPIDALTDLLVARARAAAAADAALLDAVVAVADRDPVGFDADLVAFTLAWTQSFARWQVEFGRYLQRVIKPVWTALAVGDLDLGRARVFFEVLSLTDDALAFSVALDFVDRATEWTTGQLRDRLKRAVLASDPDGAAARTARSVAQRRVVLAPNNESTANIFADSLPAMRAAAAYERLDAIARARHAAGDSRTLDQLRADTMLDLLEGVAVTAAPAHRRGIVEITIPWSSVVYGDSDLDVPAGSAPLPAERVSYAADPATLTGFGPVEAPTARAIVGELLGRKDIAWRYRIMGPSGELCGRGGLPQPRSGAALVELINTVATRRVAGASPPVVARPRSRHPSQDLATWIRARDRMCRAPGCRVPASACDIDHTIAYADGGATTQDNLALLCRHHHRLKHEAGWHVRQPAPGTLIWESPYGDRFTRRDSLT